jgi:hypothetical protein
LFEQELLHEKTATLISETWCVAVGKTSFEKFWAGLIPVYTVKVSVIQGPRNRGAMGACAPPLFLKVKKVPFFWAKVPQLQNEKKYFLNKRPLLICWKESAFFAAVKTL